jgi:BirA family biotin operon repressor/biotin-[acetyl-CoA-carboxylase] ligase
MRNSPYAYGAVSLVAAIAVIRAVAEVVPECAGLLQVKWPNDVLFSGRKVAGILSEQTLSTTSESPPMLIIGVGVNVDFDEELFPADLRHPATTLRQASNRPVMVEHVVNAVVDRLVDLLHDFEAEGLTPSLVEELRSRLAYIGSIRSIEMAGRMTSGRIAGIDLMGRLMLQSADGDVSFASGELLSVDGTD